MEVIKQSHRYSYNHATTNLTFYDTEKTCWKTFIYWMDICCRCTLELPLWGTSNVYQQHISYWKQRNLFWNIHLSRKMPISFVSLNNLNLQISIEIHVTIWQIVYIYMTAISPNLISWTMILLSWYLRGCKGFSLTFFLLGVTFDVYW